GAKGARRRGGGRGAEERKRHPCRCPSLVSPSLGLPWEAFVATAGCAPKLWPESAAREEARRVEQRHRFLLSRSPGGGRRPAAAAEPGRSAGGSERAVGTRGPAAEPSEDGSG
ncbi:unnamed protein product, partial [Prorocentrum cordatum]